ncbi:MAG: sigma 54-interacting transcriptional regulator [Syntrophomonadaceae bacterium]|nr:sigma 54-interacting transcriptional regulator [Syntrophomonadaceae bacterium]
MGMTELRSELRRKWELLHEKPELREKLRPEVRKSWHRSYKYGIQPFLQTNPYILTQNELSLALEKSQYLIHVATPVMKGLIKYILQISAGNHIAVMLADENLTLLKFYGHQDAQKWIKHSPIREGSLWSEHLVGTNGASLMSVLNKPSLVSGYENFCFFGHFSTCACAPIIDEGKTIGNIALMAPFTPVNGPTLGMVISAAKLIESRIQLERASMLPKALIESMPEGVLVVDGSGHIIFANGHCQRFFQKENQSLVGYKISDLLQEDPDRRHLINIINSGKAIKEEPLLIRAGKEKIRYNISCTPLSSFDSSQTGTVVYLWENTKTHQLVVKTISDRPKLTFDDIIGKNIGFTQCLYIAKSAASSSSNVLILGESGTGKDIIAQAIHNASSRRNKPFIAINCAALPRELIASELFGYEEGAFTGAKKGGQAGKFELADQGTIFLDEIGDMPVDLQATLLRVLEEKSVMRVGGTKTIPINARVIAATNKQLDDNDNNQFRRDLYYRLGVIKMTIPPLRERPEDIILLAKHFLETTCQRLEKPPMSLAPEVIDAFMRYDWPGNAREMQNVLEGAIHLAQDDRITYDLIKGYLISNKESILKNNDANPTVSSMEKQMILAYLEKYKYNKGKTAKALGISRRTLYRRLKEYNLL